MVIFELNLVRVGERDMKKYLLRVDVKLVLLLVILIEFKFFLKKY